MPENQYLYFLTVEGNEPFLKEEIRVFFPDLRFAYSRPGFCTFKNTGQHYSLEEMAKKPFVFALSWGINLKRISLDKLEESVKDFRKQGVHNFSYYQLSHIKDEVDLSQELQLASENIKSLTKKLVIDFIRTHGNEVFIGERLPDKWNSPLRREIVSIDPDKKVVSRAYFKGANAFKLLGLQIGKVLELGCAPGGTTQFLLEQGYEVHGIDPGEMHPELRKNPRFTFHQIPVHEYRIDRQEKFSVLTSDINLNPELVLKECARLAHFSPFLKHLLVTIKIDEPSKVRIFKKVAQLLKDMGCKEIHFLQLPHHRKEFLAYGIR